MTTGDHRQHNVSVCPAFHGGVQDVATKMVLGSRPVKCQEPADNNWPNSVVITTRLRQSQRQFTE